MSGIAVPNYKTFHQGAGANRGSADVFGTTDWSGGMNKSGSNAPGVGINTGDYSPKVSDWSQDERDPQNSQTIGHSAAVVTVDLGADVNDNVSFIQTVASTPNDGQVGATGVYNRTGVTLASGVWFWGHKPVA